MKSYTDLMLEVAERTLEQSSSAGSLQQGLQQRVLGQSASTGSLQALGLAGSTSATSLETSASDGGPPAVPPPQSTHTQSMLGVGVDLQPRVGSAPGSSYSSSFHGSGRSAGYANHSSSLTTQQAILLAPPSAQAAVHIQQFPALPRGDQIRSESFPRTSSTPSVASSQPFHNTSQTMMTPSSTSMVAALPMSTQLASSSAMMVPKEASPTYMMPGARDGGPAPTWVIEEVIDFGLPADELVREVEDGAPWNQRVCNAGGIPYQNYDNRPGLFDSCTRSVCADEEKC